MNKIKKRHFLSVSAILLSLLYALGLASATVIEKYQGRETALQLYYSPLFLLLQFLLIINLLSILFKQRYFQKKRIGLLVVHLSLIVILAGAFVTHLFSKEGTIHIREGEFNDQMVVQNAKEESLHQLPFKLELVKFDLIRYPGSTSAYSYESHLLVHLHDKTVEKKVAMNHVLTVEGYRFFQASYDKDEKGTLLQVNCDRVGRHITFLGYMFLFLGFIFCFITKESRFRQLIRSLKGMRSNMKYLFFFLALLCSSSLHLSAHEQTNNDMLHVVQKHAINREHANAFGQLTIQKRGRLMPMNTFSSEVLRKLHKKKSLGSLNANQFLLSLLSMPQMWMHVSFIAIPHDELVSYYGLSGKRCSYLDLFDDEGNYRLQAELQHAFMKKAEKRTPFDRAVIKLDEKVTIFHQLTTLQLLTIYPNDWADNPYWVAPGDNLTRFTDEDSIFISRSLSWYLSEVQHSVKSGYWEKPNNLLSTISEYQRQKGSLQPSHFQKIMIESYYNQMNLFSRCKIAYLILGLLLLITAFLQLFYHKRWLNIVAEKVLFAIVLVFLFHLFGVALRYYIAKYAPWSNSYETMVCIAWCTIAASLIFGRKSMITVALATLLAGILLVVSDLQWMDPQITPLPPVLQSPWLMFHVAIIMASYGFFGVSFLLGVTNLSLFLFATANKEVLLFRIRELSIINNLSLLTGLILMTTGTFLGAIWANESWGRYWGWDPKETWSLITILAYTITTHIHLIGKQSSLWLMNVLSVVSFFSVLMTYLGVNYFLNGLHSYANNDLSESVFFYLSLLLSSILVLFVFSYVKYRKAMIRF